MNGVIPTLITALLGAGGATFLATALRGLNTLRTGARAREREAVDDLARWRDENDEKRREAVRDRDFWRGIAGRYAYQLRTLGIEPIPPNPVPPSEQQPAV